MIQKRNILRGGVALALSVLVSNMFAPLASAAEAPSAFNILVSPPSISVEAHPGVPTSSDIRVQNQGVKAEHLTVTLMKFKAEGETGLPNLLEIKPTDDFAKWVSFSTSSITLEPNEFKTVKVSISPPKTAAFGYYYAVVFSREGAQKQIVKKKSNLLASVASLILLDVKAPGAERKVSVAEFSTKSKSVEFLPVSFNIRLHNTGNVHVATRGTVTISKHGKMISQIDVNAKNGYILPQSYRNFENQWTEGVPVYKDKIDAAGNPVLGALGERTHHLVWDNFNVKNLRYGKYDARLVMIYDDGKGDTFTEARLSFLVIPWRFIGLFALIVLIILASIWALVIRPLRNRKKHGNGYRR